MPFKNINTIHSFLLIHFICNFSTFCTLHLVFVHHRVVFYMQQKSGSVFPALICYVTETALSSTHVCALDMISVSS